MSQFTKRWVVGTVTVAALTVASPVVQRVVAKGPSKPAAAKPHKAAPKAAAVSYAKTIKPLLDAQCSGCHGAGAKKAGLDVTSIASLKKGGREAGPGVVPGKPDQSSIVLYIEGKKKPQMPMRRKPLTAAQQQAVRAWIAAGAKG
jgi:mono/diheme cytochrome c family protein